MAWTNRTYEAPKNPAEGKGTMILGPESWGAGVGREAVGRKGWSARLWEEGWGRPDGQYLEVDEDGGSQHPKALQEIPQHMHKGRPDAGVPQGQGLLWPLLQRCILSPPRPMAVGGPSLVQHKGHSEREAEPLSPAAAPSLLCPISTLPLSSPGALPPPIASLFFQPQEEDIVQERQIMQPQGKNTVLGARNVDSDAAPATK